MFILRCVLFHTSIVSHCFTGARVRICLWDALLIKTIKPLYLSYFSALGGEA